MKAVGIIAEYNPFHKGHAWQIDRARNLTGADHVIVAMSGDFVQRGAPACVDKYVRTRLALEGGADFVFEIPVVWACAAAEDYAQAGVRLLHNLGSVDSICFGSEAGNLEPLQKISDLLVEEPEEYRLVLRQELAKGSPFPAARTSALCHCLSPEFQVDDLIAEPNNILALEYLNALKKINSHMKPFTVKRQGSYHDTQGQQGFASASAVRRILEEGGEWQTRRLGDCLPEKAEQELSHHWKRRMPIMWEDFYQMLAGQLLLHQEHLADFQDYTKELANRTNRILDKCPSFEVLAEGLKTKNYTRTRIQRALLHALLQIRSGEVQRWKHREIIPYARLLGFRRSHAEWLGSTKKVSQIPIITKMAGNHSQLSQESQEMLGLDVKASHLYRMAVQMKYGKYGLEIYKNEYQQGVLVL